jgi:hypothetical protein
VAAGSILLADALVSAVDARRRSSRILDATPAALVARPAVPAPRPTAIPPAPPPLLAVVAISGQRITLHDAHGSVSSAPISTGRPGHGTPTGIFSVLQKARWHTSNIYSGAPMPYMQRLTWSGIALHAGHLPGYPASHGCIRLPESYAANLFATTRIGARVVVSPSDTEPYAVDHPLLPLAALRPLPPPPADPNAPRQDDAGPVATGAGAEQVIQVTTRAQVLSSADGPLLDPHAWSYHVREQARTHAERLARRAHDLLERANDISEEANLARGERRAAEEALVRAEARLLEAHNALATALIHEHHEVLAPKAQAERDAAAADLPQRRLDMAEHARLDEFLNDLAFTAARHAREAETAAETAAERVREFTRRAEPVSILISRKEGRVFVRQGGHMLADAPIEIRDRDAPLGTHLLVAMEADRAGGQHSGGMPMRWRAVTVAGTAGAGSAAAALDRVSIPAEITELVSERLWTNAAIMITDQGISNETGKSTDFIVLTR